MNLYNDDQNDNKYVIFNSKGLLISIQKASEEIKQKNSGGICYLLSEIISLAPIIDNYILIKELPQNNGMRRFEVTNKAKGNSRIVELRIGKIPGFPKSEKSIDIQVLFEYLKEEIREVNKELIEKIKKSKNKEFNFDELDYKEKYKLEKILIEIAKGFYFYNEKLGYGDFIEKNKEEKYIVKDKEGLMNKILSDEENFEYIIDNIPGFIMSSGGCSKNVSTILTGRPSKYFKFEDYNDDELEKIFEKLYNNCINGLNFLTISNGSHAFAIKDVKKIKGENFYLIRNPWGKGNEDDIVNTESNKILEETNNKEYSSLDYVNTGLALLNIKDIKKKFKSISSLDFEEGKYIFTQKIISEKSDNLKEYDFVINMQKKDNIKFDISNFNTDLKRDNSDNYCLCDLIIFDENFNELKKIINKDLSDINDKNVITELEEGKKYLIRVKIEKSCNINIIRNYNINKINFLGEKKDENINYCKSYKTINYSEEEEKQNNYRFEGDIKDTMKIVKIMQNYYEQPSFSQFKKISKDEIIVNGTSIFTNKLLYKVINDINNKVIKGIDANDNKEIIKIKNNKIMLFDFDITENLKNKQLLLNEEKIGIIDKENKEHYIDINDLDKFNGKIKKYFVTTLKYGKNIFDLEELTIKNNIFNNKDEAIKNIQEIAKNNAGLIKDFMTGGVEFENPKIFKNFCKYFYSYKEHIIAFKCEPNATKDIKETLKRILNNDVYIDSIQQVWETILDELIDGFLIGGCLPFISLHFNVKSLLYSVMNTNYKHTIVGHVLTFIDYFLKGFTNGSYFDEKFVYDWYENSSKNFENTQNECQNDLFYHAHNLFQYIYNNNLDINYSTTNGIYKDMLGIGKQQYYIATNRIIGKMSDLYFYDNVLFPEFNFKVEGDLDPLPFLIEELNKLDNNLKWEKTKKAHEIMKTRIKNQMNKLPFLKGYFYLLDMITFAIYYLASIKSISALPDISNSLKKRYSKNGKFYIKVIPSVYPPLPTTKYIYKDYSILFNDLVNKMNKEIITEINDTIFIILNKNLEEYFSDDLKNRMLKEIENIIIDDCMNKYNELSKETKNSLKYAIQDLNIICKDLYELWILRIDAYKDLIKELNNEAAVLSENYPNISIKNIFDIKDKKIPLLNKLNSIKGINSPMEKEFNNEQNSYMKLVRERIINKRYYISNIFNFEQIESIAKEIKDNELIEQIERYKFFDNFMYKLNELIKSLTNKNFYQYFTYTYPYKTNMSFRIVGYHEGSSSIRGGCLIDYNQTIELKEKKDDNKNKKIKKAINKEEVKIGEESFFIVNTKIKSLLYDKENLLEIDKSNNSLDIVNNNFKNDKGLSSTFLKILSKNKKIYNTIYSNDLINIDESNENILTYLPSISNSKLVEDLLLTRQNSIKNIPKGNNMITPLLSAITIQNLDISEILIKGGFNINDTTDINFSPLHFASYYNLPKIVKLLLEKNANLHLKTKKEGEIPLHLACRKGNFEIVKLLLKDHYYIDQIKSDNKTSLHLASMTSSLCTQILIKNNASIILKDNNGYLASHLAIIYGREDIFNLIERKKLYNEGKQIYCQLNYDINENDFNINNDNVYSVIKKLCGLMRRNDLKGAEKLTDFIIGKDNIMNELKNNKNIQEKIIRNACKGLSIKYLNILFKLIDLRINESTIFFYIYKYNLDKWIIELKKNFILFSTEISDYNWYILEYLLKNDNKEFIKLMKYLDIIPEEYLSKILSIKCLNRIEIEDFEKLFKQFLPENINLHSFCETSLTTVEDIDYLIKHKNDFGLNFNSLNLIDIAKFCRPSVFNFFLSNKNHFSNINYYNTYNDIVNEIIKAKRTDNFIKINPESTISDFFNEKMKLEKKNKNTKNKFKLDELNYKNKNEKLSNLNKSETYDIDIYNNYNFCLHEFTKNKNIFDLIIETKKFEDLTKIYNFPLNLINKEILFGNFENLENVSELPLKSIFECYLSFIENNINNKFTEKKFEEVEYYSYIIELIDIILLEQRNSPNFNSLYEKTIKALVEVLFTKQKYKKFLSLLAKLKTSQDENIMHIIADNKVLINETTQINIMYLLELIKKETKNEKLFKNLFNNRDKHKKTFLMYLNFFNNHALFVEIYSRYKQFINPFIFNSNHNNLLFIIINNLKDDPTMKSCLFKYIIIIKEIIFKYPNIIFLKNKWNNDAVSLIFTSNNNMTGILNIMTKVFTFDSLNKYSEKDLILLTLNKNNLFILRHLVEYYNLNVNKLLKDGIYYPLNEAYHNIELFKTLIEYGANPFLKNKYNNDSITYSMLYANNSFLEYLYNMKMNEICFSDKYLFHLAKNKNGFDIFKKLIKNKNIDLNILDSNGESLLMKACQGDNYELINILINNGINPLLKDNLSNTALHHCCINNSINSMNILLQKLYYKSTSLLKKNLLISNIYDNTPLHLAARNGYLEITEKILVYMLSIENNKNNIRIKSKGEFLPVHYSIINGKIQLSLFLINALNIIDEEIEDINKDSFYDKIKDFISNKKIYFIENKKIGNFF